MNHIENLKEAFEHIAMARQKMDKGPAYSKIVVAQELLIGTINQMKQDDDVLYKQVLEGIPNYLCGTLDEKSYPFFLNRRSDEGWYPAHVSYNHYEFKEGKIGDILRHLTRRFPYKEVNITIEVLHKTVPIDQALHLLIEPHTYERVSGIKKTNPNYLKKRKLDKWLKNLEKKLQEEDP